MKDRLILHIHTTYSPDSSITLADILSICKEKEISCIGITDHETAQGALTFRNELEKNNIRVIIGEELRTEEGEIIGLFLGETIKCRLEKNKFISLALGIKSIKEQKGLVFIPHPFDKLRLGIGQKNIEKYARDIDALEIFNSRTKLNSFNTRSKVYTSKRGLIKFIGSDAHCPEEIANTIIELGHFVTPDEFLQSLGDETTSFYTKRLSLRNIIRPTLNKFSRRFKRLFGNKMERS